MEPNSYDRRVVQEEIVQTPQGAEARIVEQRTHIDPTPAERQIGKLIRAKQILWFVVGLIIALVLLRFALLILGANMETGFGGFMLAITQPLVMAFLPLFGEQQSRYEFADLIAVAVFLLIGWGISKLLEIMLMPRTPSVRY